MIDEFLKNIERIPPSLLKKLLSGFIWEGTPDSGTMALTFDDGPDPDVTPVVLDALDEAGVRGTFFIIGEKAVEHPDIVRDIAARGHLIGSHTMHHQKLILMNMEDVAEEIQSAQDCIADITGVDPCYFRPPHGLFDFTCASVVREKNLTMTLWTVLSGDYSDDSRDAVMKTVEPFIRPGSVIVFHDTKKGGGMELPGMIRDISSKAAGKSIHPGGIDELSLSSEITLDEQIVD